MFKYVPRIRSKDDCQNGLGQVSTGMLEDIGVKKDTSKILGQTPP